MLTASASHLGERFYGPTRSPRPSRGSGPASFNTHPPEIQNSDYEPPDSEEQNDEEAFQKRENHQGR
jgi:hypothetical protein